MSDKHTGKRTETHACDLIDRQEAIDIGRRATVDTNPEHFESHQKFVEFMDDAEISSFGRWQWSNGFNTALTAVGIDLKRLSSAQPEQHWIPCSERLPEVGEDGESDYILLSFSNYSLPTIGRYQVDDEGGAFYDGDDDKTLVSYGLFVNAWMPLIEPYKGETE